MEARQRQSRGYASRTLARKFLGFMSKRKRDEEKRRLDLWKAMRDSSVERLAAVITSARTDFGDQLNDLCADAELVLQRLLREGSEESAAGRPTQSGTRRKITLRERLMLADIEGTVNETEQANRLMPENTEVACSSTVSIEMETGNRTSSDTAAAEAPPMLQAVLTLMRPSAAELQDDSRGTALNQGDSTSSGRPPSEESTQQNTGGRRLLSALLWEERNLDDDMDHGWVAFGVSVEAPIHFDHSRSQSVGGELTRIEYHRPTASVDGMVRPDTSTTSVSVVPAAGAPMSTVPETPMRVSLMSLLREAEDGSSIIFMNRQMISTTAEGDSPNKEALGGAEHVCCVCMGCQKGAAFIPCGHTFCRKCSRELHRARGTCPLCNKEIKDILNLY